METKTISRRRFLRSSGAAAVAGISAPYVVLPSRAANKELVFVGFGGAYQDGQTKAYFEPFERDTGVKIIQTSGVELAKLKAQVQSKNVEWDLVTLPDRQRFTAVQDGLLTPLNYSIIDKSDILQEVVSEYAIGHVTVIMQLVYSTSFYKPGSEPKTWADFWNRQFPGKRAMYNAPAYVLEIALLVDGVPKDKLYPLDIPRALKSLDRIKRDVIWWTQFPQPGVMLKSGEITMTPWTRGITHLLEGDLLGVSYEDAILSFEGWTVPAGARNRDLAMQFINYAIKPERQAALTNYVAFGPTNPKALPLVDAKVAKWLPTNPEHWQKGVLLSGDWWGPNLQKATEQWNEWRLT
jgi:putative spermidine/putrescine transport system substrate-binding protein